MANILWIDDKAGKASKETSQRMAFDALIYFIEKNGHSVTIAATRNRIEEILSDQPAYDLLILDIIMEALDSSSQTEHQYGGIDVLERLATINSRIPIIVLSVMTSRMIRAEAELRHLDLKNIGVKEIKRKGSVTPTELADSVEQYLGTRDQRSNGGNP